MGSVNSCPVVSQAKSVILATGGEIGEAVNVQLDFFHEFPVLSQMTSVLYFFVGNFEKAGQTQLRFFCAVSRFLDTIPIIGHFKAFLHYMVGSQIRAVVSVQSATRSALLFIASMAGALRFGRSFAAPCAIFTGFWFDTVICRRNREPHGLWRVIIAAENENLDVFFATLADGLVGSMIATDENLGILFPFLFLNVAADLSKRSLHRL